jgi:2-haloacid dehalogenase
VVSAVADVRAVLFDAYGTLFRLEAIERACAAALGSARGDPPAAADFAALWRTKQLEYSLHRSLMGAARYVDFEAITAEALDYALARFALDLPPGARPSLLRAWRTLDADPDARAALAALAPLPRAILSNGSPAMLEEATLAAGLADHLEAILSADAVRVYKPHPSVYALGAERFGLEPDRIAFVTGNAWDAAGAGAFGFRVCWINGTGLPADRHGPPPTAIVGSLADVPALLGHRPADRGE